MHNSSKLNTVFLYLTSLLIWSSFVFFQVSGHANDSIGSKWVETKSGCKVWNKHPHPNEVVTWYGKCKDGYVDGVGKLTFEWFENVKQVELIEGEFSLGKVHGQAIMKSANGDLYSGGFKNSFLSGHGNYKFSDGTKYVGEFREDKINGLGMLILPNGEQFVGEFIDGLLNGRGTYARADGSEYKGEFKNFKMHGLGLIRLANDELYIGEFIENKLHGQATHIKPDGRKIEGVWEHNKFIREAKVNIPNLISMIAESEGRHNLVRERQRLTSPLVNSRLNLQVSSNEPASDGSFRITVFTNTDTASLKINGDEIGGRENGNYSVNLVARAGQDTTFEITAIDIYGNTAKKKLTVTRPVIESKVAYASLNPAKIKRQAERDAVAIIIGISSYRTLPTAAHADDDAKAFYDYAIRALGVKAENIKLLINQDAGEIEIYKAFKTWLPSRVRVTTDVYVFYSGHGYTTFDGKGLYWFPHQADPDLISKTAILVEELNADILASKPKSVTVFADACYSGQTKSGETLISSGRPLVPKVETRLFPETFTVITASKHDQISSSSPDLRHGIFSYYLMRGMEGEADSNRDGKITLGEMQSYLVDNVVRQAASMSRKQEPQLNGDTNLVLVGR
jgi:hypothetical protein